MKLSYRARRRPSRASVFFFLLAILFVGVNYLLADEAHAAHDPELTVEFAQLDLVQRRGGLVLNYEVSKRDWRAMRRLEIEPRLNLYTRDGRRDQFSYAYSLPLESRVGRIVYPEALQLRGTKVVELEVIGFAGFNRVTKTRFGDACDGKVRLRVRRGNSGHGHGTHAGNHGHGDHGHGHGQTGPRDDTAEIIAACRKHTSSSFVAACMKRAQALPRETDRVATINACGNATSWDSEFGTCMDRAKTIRSSAAAVITACDAQTQWNSELVGCMRRVSEWESPYTASIINACGDATQWSSEFNACLSRSDSFGRRGEQVIRACSNATTWNSEFNSCLDQAATTPRRTRQRT